MMQKIAAVIGFVFLGLVGVTGLAFLGAYPTKWLVNYLFSHQLLVVLFGVPVFGFWKALCLNLFLGLVIKSGAGKQETK